MVAVIKIGQSIRGILHYNEIKVAEGEAKLILASGFAGEIDKMTFQNKMQRFSHLTGLKPTVKTNAVHISLNFDASEQINNTKMQEIATAYMERIGFGDQPFLVYRHNDAGHQHFHIATTTIQRNGEAISMHNIGRDVSEPARKAIEKEFNLVVAENKSLKVGSAIKPINIQKAIYGKLSTKRQISNVLTGVVKDYKFTSLGEFNAILQQFNVTADRGQMDTKMFQNKGLVYSLIDSKGEKIGIPIKSSTFYSKPTLRNLESLFNSNIEKRKPYKLSLLKRIDSIFSKYEKVTLSTIKEELKKNGIELVLRKNDQGRVYGSTFIDHQNGTVFNGSDLGKSYSANGLMAQISLADLQRSFLKPLNVPKIDFVITKKISVKSYLEQSAPTNFLNNLLSQSQPDFAPGIKRKKKRKKRGLTL